MTPVTWTSLLNELPWDTQWLLSSQPVALWPFLFWLCCLLLCSRKRSSFWMLVSSNSRPEVISLPRDSWQCAEETFGAVVSGGAYFWHLVSRGQGCCRYPEGWGPGCQQAEVEDTWVITRLSGCSSCVWGLFLSLLYCLFPLFPWPVVAAVFISLKYVLFSCVCVCADVDSWWRHSGVASLCPPCWGQLSQVLAAVLWTLSELFVRLLWLQTRLPLPFKVALWLPVTQGGFHVPGIQASEHLVPTLSSPTALRDAGSPLSTSVPFPSSPPLPD